LNIRSRSIITDEASLQQIIIDEASLQETKAY